MEQRPSLDTDGFSASQEILPILWNPKVNFCNQKCLPPVPILSQIDLLRVLISYLLKIHLTIVLPSTPGSPKWSDSLRFSQKTPVYASTHPHNCYMPRPTHSSRFDHRNCIGWRVQIIKFLLLYFSPFNCYLFTLRPKYCPQHAILKHLQPTFLPPCERPSFTPIQNSRQNCNCVYLKLCVLDSKLEDNDSASFDSKYSLT